MKKVKLLRLTLENWRAQNRTIDFSDKTIIRGANGTGKSSITAAFLWLLQGVDEYDRSNYDLYDNTKEFTYENAIPAVVEGVFDIDDVEYTFKRSAKQKWTRPRGKSEYVKDKSDEYTYYIDGLAVSAKVYKERIEGLFADMDKLKLMLNVRYYQLLDWKTLRKHFSDLVGVIDESELKGDYSSIKDLLAKHLTTEAVKEKLRQEINPLKKTNESIESEIKGMKAMLPSLEGVDEATAMIAEKQARVAEIDKEIMGLGTANKPFIEKREKELADIRSKKEELSLAEKEWNDEQGSKVSDIEKSIQDIDAINKQTFDENNKIESQRKSLSRQIEMAQQQVQFQTEDLERLRKENMEIKARVFDENLTCQSCGQPLPLDKITELKEAFYAKREADHKACVEKGLRVKDNIAKQNELIDDLNKQISELPESQPIMSKDALLNELDDAKLNAIPFEHSEIYKILNNQLEFMESHLTIVPEVNSTELMVEKNKLNADIRELNAITAKKVAYDNGLRQIEAKEKEQSNVGIELARLEGLYDKCVEREREWASIVRDRANKHLHFCKVEMTELSKAGELNDICSITIDGVDVGVANTARQIVAGIDIAEAFQMNAGLNLPLFIDNAEQICDCNIPVVSNQKVLTYVDANYRELTVI